MKKWVVLFLLIGFWSCVTENVDEVTQTEGVPEFNLQVPSDFSWSAVVQDVLLVNVMYNEAQTFALDGTVMELYGDSNELIDALTIFRGVACFNLKIPTSTKSLTLKSAVTGNILEFSSTKRSVDFEVSEIVKLDKNDTDNDGLFDQFDAEPNNPDIALKITNSDKNSLSSYFIFEDLWPSKGDFDFNDFIVKTDFTWTRGGGNFITEITGICEAQWDDSQFGLGFELFEAKGTCLIYLDDVIQEIEGAEESELIENGFIVLNESEFAGQATKKFTLKIKDNSLANFVCVPFLYRIGKENHQIRPFGTPPTSVQQMQMFHSQDDASPRNWNWIKGEKFKYPLAGDDAFYRTKEGHPWGVQFLSKSFVPSAEMQSILTSYPKFKTWAESGGKKDKDWYNYPAITR